MNKNDVIEKVEALIAKAQSTTYSAERDALLAKADALMLKYAIESYELGQKDPNQREEPVVVNIPVVPANTPLKHALADLFHAVVLHARCKAVYWGLTEAKSPLTARVVGFPSDIEYVKVLYTSLTLQLAMDMEPKYDDDLSEMENIHAMRLAGVPWQRIAELQGVKNPAHYKSVRDPYQRWCEENGVEYAKGSALPYQRSFVKGFSMEVSKRFHQMKREQRETETPGTALVLSDRSSEVDELYRQHFGGARGVKGPDVKFKEAAYKRGKTSGANADLSGGRKTVSNSRRALNG